MAKLIIVILGLTSPSLVTVTDFKSFEKCTQAEADFRLAVSMSNIDNTGRPSVSVITKCVYN